VLHKYFYLLCISSFVFGHNLSVFETLIPFIILFLSFSYLGLIVLDRIHPKRAFFYILSMLGCCGIIIGIFAGLLFILSFLFYTDSGDAMTSDAAGIPVIPSFVNASVNASSNATFVLFNTTSIETTDVDFDAEASEDDVAAQTWWIKDFFYPIFAFILCSNTMRRIRRGFDNNIPEIKYTLWSNCCFVSLIMIFATNSATWSKAEVKAVFLLVFVYMGYLWAQMRAHQAVTRLKKIEYANKYLQESKWVKTQLCWMWLGQLSKRF